MESTIRPTEEDMLIQLPSDVLVSILEKLSLREAVRVGVLSRRWRCLPAQLSRLALDIDHFLPGDARDLVDYDDGVDGDTEGEEEDSVALMANEVHDGLDDHIIDGEEDEVTPAPTTMMDDDGYHDFFSEAGDRMADAATALLASRRPGGGSNNLDIQPKLSMRFYLRHNYISLGRLLDDAVACGKVRTAELTITTTFRPFLSDDDHESTQRTLLGYGRRFRALFDACPMAFGALTQLTLEKMTHGRSDWDDILTACTRLERLSLSYCGPGEGRLWRVRHARLKEIKILLCAIRGIKLDWLPTLERFTLQSWFLTTDQLVSFGHVPRLTTVTLSDDNNDSEETLKLSRILANNTALSDLRLNFRDSNIWVQPETSRFLTDAFRNLKNLKIRNVHRDCGLLWTMFLLQSAPHLQELYIKLMEHDCQEFARKNVPWEVDTSFKHYSLARVTIVGFYSTEETLVTFIRHLVEAAVNLEEIRMRENMTLCCVICGHTEPPAGSRFPRTDQDRDAFRKKITDGGPTTTFKIYIKS